MHIKKQRDQKVPRCLHPLNSTATAIASFQWVTPKALPSPGNLEAGEQAFNTCPFGGKTTMSLRIASTLQARDLLRAICKPKQVNELNCTVKQRLQTNPYQKVVNAGQKHDVCQSEVEPFCKHVLQRREVSRFGFPDVGRLPVGSSCIFLHCEL